MLFECGLKLKAAVAKFGKRGSSCAYCSGDNAGERKQLVSEREKNNTELDASILKTNCKQGSCNWGSNVDFCWGMLVPNCLCLGLKKKNSKELTKQSMNPKCTTGEICTFSGGGNKSTACHYTSSGQCKHPVYAFEVHSGGK